MSESIRALKERMAEIGHLGRIAGVLEWDLQTYMPPGGAAARSEQIALISRMTHEMFTAEETGDLLAKAEAEAASLDGDSDEARMVRNLRRSFDRAVKIPTSLAAEFARQTTLSQEIWARARAESDFAAFAPSLERNLELVRQIVSHLGYENDPYDALLDQYEKGMKTAEVSAIFETLKPHLIDLTRAIAERAGSGDEPITGHFPIADQNALTSRLAADLGYDYTRGRQDQAPHPFCINFSRDDVRITTRFKEDEWMMGVYATLHETGHALYEQGSPAEYENTALAGGVSSGVHESQSRLWENLVGRSRAYCIYLLPRLQEAFPEAFSGVTVDRLYRSVNRVRPSFIRVEADEVTYNLHILLRFELERELLSGRLRVADLPAVWNARMEEYLGITPPDDRRGVLQDIHWSAGLVGYFPTYTLGNLLAAQLWDTAQRAIPDLEAHIERGEFAPLLEWLRANVHAYGSKFEPNEVIRKATGAPLSSEHFTRYLQTKFGALYGLA